jgi:hypothetical protein
VKKSISQKNAPASKIGTCFLSKIILFLLTSLFLYKSKSRRLRGIPLLKNGVIGFKAERIEQIYIVRCSGQHHSGSTVGEGN